MELRSVENNIYNYLNNVENNLVQSLSNQENNLVQSLYNQENNIINSLNNIQENILNKIDDNQLRGWQLTENLTYTEKKKGNDNIEIMLIDSYVKLLGRNPNDEEIIDGKKIIENGGLAELENILIRSQEYLKLRNLDPISDLTGQIVIITGISSGFGFQLAVETASRGATVIGNSRTPEIFNASILSAASTNRDDLPHPLYLGQINVSDEILSRINHFTCDVRKKEDIEKFINFIKENYDTSKISSIFINHGVANNSSSIEDSYISLEEDILSSPNRFVSNLPLSNSPLNTQFWGNIFTLKPFINLLVNSKEKNKYLIFTGSITGLGAMWYDIYAETKTNNMFNEMLKLKNIYKEELKVCSIAPSFNMTDMVGTGSGLINIPWTEVKIVNQKLIFPLTDQLISLGFKDTTSNSFKNITFIGQQIMNNLNNLSNINYTVYNPLTIVTGMLDLLQPNTKSGTIIIQDLGSIPGSNVSITNLNQNKIQRFEPSEFNMSQEKYELVYSGFNKNKSMQIFKDLIIEQYSGYKNYSNISDNGISYKMM